jgi:hypothetical protein
MWRMTGSMAEPPGASMKFAIARKWSTKLAYLFVDVGSFDCCLACGLGVPQNVGLTAQYHPYHPCRPEL